jgi:hypothetical protein
VRKEVAENAEKQAKTMGTVENMEHRKALKIQELQK